MIPIHFPTQPPSTAVYLPLSAFAVLYCSSNAASVKQREWWKIPLVVQNTAKRSNMEAILIYPPVLKPRYIWQPILAKWISCSLKCTPAFYLSSPPPPDERISVLSHSPSSLSSLSSPSVPDSARKRQFYPPFFIRDSLLLNMARCVGCLCVSRNPYRLERKGERKRGQNESWGVCVSVHACVCLCVCVHY